MSSPDDVVYTTPQHLIDQKVRRNVLGQIVRKKQPVMVDDNDPEAEGYHLARINSCGSEASPVRPKPISKPSTRRKLSFWESFSQWRCRKYVVVLTIIISILLAVIGVLVWMLVGGKHSMYNSWNLIKGAHHITS